jgi:catechol 2,3-dioxygenase-like lactoylglutathione lyase family enzyme
VSLPPTIQHLAMSVPDPERSAAYYSAALAPLGAVARLTNYTSDRGERAQVVVIEHTLSLMLHPSDEQRAPLNPYAPGAVHHIGIHVDSPELVDEIARAADAAGGRISDGPRAFPDEYRFGYYGVFLRDPDEIKWEVFCYADLASLTPTAT